MDPKQKFCHHNNADSYQHEGHALPCQEGLPEIDCGDGIRYFGNSQRCQIKQEAIAQHAEKVAGDFRWHDGLKQEYVDKSGSLTDLALPVRNFVFTDNHRNDRAPKKTSDGEANDATKEPAAPEEGKANCLAPGVDSNWGKQRARKESHHC